MNLAEMGDSAQEKRAHRSPSRSGSRRCSSLLDKRMTGVISRSPARGSSNLWRQGAACRPDLPLEPPGAAEALLLFLMTQNWYWLGHSRQHI